MTPLVAKAGTTGTVSVYGSTGGTATIQPQASFTSYNFNLPTGAGSSGQPLLSAGGGSTAMTFGTLGVGAGGTGSTTTFMQGSVVFAGASGVYSQDNSQVYWDDSNHRFAIGTASPSKDLSFGGAAARQVWVERATSGAGNNLTLSAGGAQSSTADIAGGNLILSAGLSTGTSTSNVQVQTYPAAASTSSSDNTALTALTITATGATGTTAATTLQGNAGSGSNKNGGTLILASGISTGTGTSSINFKVYGAGSSGSTANSATTAMTIASTGNVGIGTASPGVGLDVNTGVRAGSSSNVTTCGSGQANGEGTIRVNYATHNLEYCNGITWVSTAQLRSGYFVLTKTTYNGNFSSTGDNLTTVDAACLTELTTNTGWWGYATANANGQLVAGKVHGFQCTATTCNSLTANTTYYFANANDSSAGGATFTTDPYGIGPNDNADWSDLSHFNTAVNWWSGFRDWLTDSYWDDVPTGTGWQCMTTYPWDTGDSSKSAVIGCTGNTNYTRWWCNNMTCDNLLPIICSVDP